MFAVVVKFHQTQDIIFMRSSSCIYCNSSSYSKINTYKHIWWSCNNCGNILCENRSSYIFEFLPKYLSKFIHGEYLNKVRYVRGLKNLISDLGRGSNSIDLYDTYLDDGKVDSSGTAWEGISSQLMEEFESYGLSFSDKNVLDVSGGPGYVIKELSQHCNKAVVTEYSPSTVRRMSEILGMESYQYDFNKDRISDVVNDKFDVVLIRHSINFCKDLNKMAASLKAVLNEGAVVYLTFVPPTLASCLRWQMEDYIYHVLLKTETVKKIFMNEGFVEIASQTNEASYYTDNKRIYSAIFFFTRIMNSTKRIDKTLTTKSAKNGFKLQ